MGDWIVIRVLYPGISTVGTLLILEILNKWDTGYMVSATNASDVFIESDYIISSN